MHLYGLARHEQCLGDLPVAQSLRRHLGDAALAGGQRIGACPNHLARARAGDLELLPGAFSQGHRPTGVSQLAAGAQRLPGRHALVGAAKRASQLDQGPGMLQHAPRTVEQ